MAQSVGRVAVDVVPNLSRFVLANHDDVVDALATIEPRLSGEVLSSLASVVLERFALFPR